MTGANQNSLLGTYKNTNLILKTTEWIQIICVLVSTKSAVLIRSGDSYVAVEVKV